MKKLLISILIGVTFLFSLAPFSAANAQTWYNQTFPEWYLKVYDSSNPNEIFGERYTAAQVQWIVYSIPSLLINFATNGNADLGSCLVGSTNGTLDIELCATTMIDTLTDISSSLGLSENSNVDEANTSQLFQSNSLSGIGYVKGVIEKLNPVTTVGAAGPGYGITAIKSIAFLWKAVRNLAYFFFVIVTVVLAFMIMFRVKLSPQVVISVQSALPKLIIALILVTFSFAIAGFMIDIMYVIMGIFSMFIAGSVSSDPAWGVAGVTNYVFNFINGTALPFVNGGLAILVYLVIYLVLFVIALVFAFIAAVLGLNISSVIFTLCLVIFAVILILIIIWYMLKVTYVLYKNLAAVYGLIIIAPLQITTGVLFPQAGFGSWLKKLFSKLMIFPLTGMFIYLANLLCIYSIRLSIVGIAQDNFLMPVWNNILILLARLGINVSQNLIITGEWAPPMLGNAASASAIAFMLMSVGLIMMLPKIGESIESFMAGKGFAGTAIGEAMGPFGTFGKSAVGSVTGAYQRGAGERFADDYAGRSTFIAKTLRNIGSSSVGQKLHLSQIIDDVIKGNQKR